MNTQRAKVYRLQNVEIDASRMTLKRDGEERHLRPQPFQVLVYLVEHRSKLVSKDELITHVWGETAVTDNALEQCVAEIRKVLADDPRNPRFIKTVPRAGYRFIGDVEEIGSELRTTASTPGSQPAARTTEKPGWITRRTTLVAILLIGIIGIVTAIFLVKRSRERSRSLSSVTLPEKVGKRSVAVMFFDNQSGSADLDWLREGLADMLITGLSRSKNLTILSRQQLHILLDRAGRRSSEKISLEEALDVAQKSKATIVIMGSFARLGEQIRLDAQLHDARDGQLLAAERVVLDQPEQILRQVDLLALKLASHLGASDQSGQSDLASVMTSDLAAYRYYSLAVEKTREVQNPEAIALLEKAIAIDPDFAMAYARIGYTYAVGWGRPEEAKPYLEKAFKLTQRLSEKDKLNISAWYALANRDYPGAIRSFQELLARYPLEVESYRRLGTLLHGEERLSEAVEILKQGLVIDPESKDLYNGLGRVYSDFGRHDEAIAVFQRYVKLAPDEPNAHDSLGLGYQWAGRYHEAVQEYERALALNPNFYIALIHLGNTRYQQGRYQEALQHFRRYIQIAASTAERGRGYASVSVLERSRGRLDAAGAAARQAWANDPENQNQIFFLALQRGDLSAAEKIKQSLEKIDPKGRGSRGNAREVRYYQGLFALKNGRANEAVEKFKEALHHRPITWFVDPFEDCLANGYLELRRFDEAIAEYERILKLNSNYPRTHYYLAQAFERKGQPEQARVHYAKFLDMWKEADADVPEVTAARKVLGR